MISTQPKLVGKLLVETAVGAFLGDRRIRLLEAIDKYGSISQAARLVPLSYKAAWEAVDEMNNLAPEPVVLRFAGGRSGGGTELTAFGRRLIAFYRALEQEYQCALETLSASLDQAAIPDVAEFRRALKRMSIRTSARNQFAGPIVAVRNEVVDAEVTIGLEPDMQVTARVTKQSAENLGLGLGREVLALVKASSILLLADEDERISVRNRFRGQIATIQEGPVNAEVTLNLTGARYVVTAVITQECVRRMELSVGKTVTAAFEASSVFLVAVD